MKAKLCKRCVKEKPLDAFYLRGAYRDSVCSRCRCTEQNENYYRRKARKQKETKA